MNTRYNSRLLPARLPRLPTVSNSTRRCTFIRTIKRRSHTLESSPLEPLDHLQRVAVRVPEEDGWSPALARRVPGTILRLNSRVTRFIYSFTSYFFLKLKVKLWYIVCTHGHCGGGEELKKYRGPRTVNGMLSFSRAATSGARLVTPMQKCLSFPPSARVSLARTSSRSKRGVRLTAGGVCQSQVTVASSVATRTCSFLLGSVKGRCTLHVREAEKRKKKNRNQRR